MWKEGESITTAHETRSSKWNSSYRWSQKQEGGSHRTLLKLNSAKGQLFPPGKARLFFFNRFILIFAAILSNLLICYKLLIKRMRSESCLQPWIETWRSEPAGRSNVYYPAEGRAYHYVSFRSQPKWDSQSLRHKTPLRKDVCSKIRKSTAST